MASYPGAVFTRADIVPGQTAQPADVNDLVAEISAIEAGLLTGTAPVTSSHASVQGLHVTGNSTFGSTITIGTLTYVFPTVPPGSTGQALTVVSTGPVIALEWRGAGVGQPLVRVVGNSTVTITNGAPIGLSWGSVAQARGGAMFSSSVNSSRLTFVDSTGLWLVGCQITYGQGPAGIINLWILHNDTNVVAFDTTNSSNVGAWGQSVSGLVNVTSTSDYVIARVKMVSASTASLSSQATATPAAFWAYLVSR